MFCLVFGASKYLSSPGDDFAGRDVDHDGLLGDNKGMDGQGHKRLVGTNDADALRRA